MIHHQSTKVNDFRHQHQTIQTVKYGLIQEFESVDLLAVRSSMDELLAKIQQNELGY